MHDLVQRSISGHPESRNRLLALLTPRVRQMARYYSFRCVLEREDLEQEIWLGILTALQEVDVTIGDPVEYLLKRGRWKALETIKRRFRHGEESIEGMEPCDPRDGPETHAMGSLLLDHLRSRLTTAQKQVLDGRLAGLSGEEMATRFGCTPANVSYHLRRIRELLQVLLTA